MHLLTSKPVLYVCNVGEDEFLSNTSELAEKVAKFAENERNLSLNICSQMEAEIAQLEPSDRQEFLQCWTTLVACLVVSDISTPSLHAASTMTMKLMMHRELQV